MNTTSEPKRPRGRPVTGESERIIFRAPPDIVAAIDAQPGTRTQVLLSVIRKTLID